MNSGLKILILSKDVVKKKPFNTLKVFAKIDYDILQEFTQEILSSYSLVFIYPSFQLTEEQQAYLKQFAGGVVFCHNEFKNPLIDSSIQSQVHEERFGAIWCGFDSELNYQVLQFILKSFQTEHSQLFNFLSRVSQKKHFSIESLENIKDHNTVFNTQVDSFLQWLTVVANSLNLYPLNYFQETDGRFLVQVVHFKLSIAANDTTVSYLNKVGQVLPPTKFPLIFKITGRTDLEIIQLFEIQEESSSSSHSHILVICQNTCSIDDMAKKSKGCLEPRDKIIP
jgi:hypothetical protein